MTRYEETWRLKSDSVSWDYELAHPDGPELPPHRAYARLLERFLAICEGFAIPEGVRLTTTSEGEDAFVFKLSEPGQRDQLTAALETRDDIEDAEISLTLVYEPSAGGSEARVPGGAIAWLTREQNPEDRSSPFRLLLTLNADLYAFVSWGRQRDNTVLATRNAPRLAAFLHRIEEQLGGRLMGIEAPSYEGQVHRYGFRPPS